MKLNNIEMSLPVWRKWRALGKRFLPSQIVDEPQPLLDDVLTIEAVAHLLQEQDSENA